VYDGKQGTGYDRLENLQMTPDGAHCVFIASGVGGARVVLDGTEGAPYAGISDVEQAPDGRVAYIGRKITNEALLVVGGQEIPNTQTFGRHLPYTGQSSLPHVAFSPDGKRYAYVVAKHSATPGTITARTTVVVDGKPGLEYAGANELQFSSDGKRFA